MSDLRVTPLHALHQELGAKLVPFAGYEMPVQYRAGVMKEHQHCRAAAGLFDVSHMGQVIIRHPDGIETAATAFEGLAPVDVLGIKEDRQRYALFTNEHGGIEDDFMIANRGDHLLAVVNAACKQADVARMTEGLPGCEVTEITDRGLLALQGPKAEAALEGLVPGVAEMKFMDVATLQSDWGELWISRSGYTGEDGYEISVEAAQTEALARALLAIDVVEPIGLGARDSLRLEAGLCLYGNDIDSGTTPVEAGLTWAIQKVRRASGARAGGFPGADVILGQLEDGPTRRRIGLRPEGRAPMREGTQLYAHEDGEDVIGHVTSGAFGPTLGAPMSMGYVGAQFAEKGETVWGEVRGKRLPAKVAAMPFVPNHVKR